jgi:CBS domain containing-hemolysin-like protein
MNKLTLRPVPPVVELASPQRKSRVSLDTSALEFFTDFALVQPLMVESSVIAAQAREIMIKTHVRMQFVVDDIGRFLGIISADDLAERKIVQRVAEGYSRRDITVADLMIPKGKLMAINLEEVTRASIGDVVTLLKDFHQQHCLVIDQQAQQVRGIFSSSDISRKLRLPINIQDRSDFYRVFAAIQ